MRARPSLADLDERHRFGLASMSPSPKLKAAIERILLSLPERARPAFRRIGLVHGSQVLLDVLDALRESQRALRADRMVG